ncbi:MAG: hypothetical protein ABEI80_06060 [Haloplanus sp.]
MAGDTRRRDGSTRPRPLDRAGSMRARTWAVATQYCDPSDYDIPALPTWAVTRPAEGGVAFAGSHGESPFIRAERPTKVRR